MLRDEHIIVSIYDLEMLGLTVSLKHLADGCCVSLATVHLLAKGLEACFLLLQILLLFVVYGSFPIKPCFAGGHWNHTQSTMEYLS